MAQDVTNVAGEPHDFDGKPDKTENTIYSFHSPINPYRVAGFQSNGGGAFKTMPVSPKVSFLVLPVVLNYECSLFVDF